MTQPSPTPKKKKKRKKILKFLFFFFFFSLSPTFDGQLDVGGVLIVRYLERVVSLFAHPLGHDAHGVVAEQGLVGEDLGHVLSAPIFVPRGGAASKRKQ
jgi:hypothetical protein